MGRPRIEFRAEQEKEIYRLFLSGMNTKDIGKVFKCDLRPIQRVLRARYGDLRKAAAIALRARRAGRGGLLHQDYREGFEAGVRMALTWVSLHGIESTREYCNRSLLPWREMALDDIPPEFGRSS